MSPTLRPITGNNFGKGKETRGGDARVVGDGHPGACHVAHVYTTVQLVGPLACLSLSPSLSRPPSLPRPPSLLSSQHIPHPPTPPPTPPRPLTTNEQQQPQPNATHYYHHRPRKPICPAPQNPLQQQQRHAPGAPIHTLQCASRPPGRGSLPPLSTWISAAALRCGVQTVPGDAGGVTGPEVAVLRLGWVGERIGGAVVRHAFQVWSSIAIDSF
jgi:hypothetical protein